MANKSIDSSDLAVNTRIGTCDAEPTDRQLLQRFAAEQDEDAFELLVRRHGPMVLSVCRRMLQDPHAAEDAFQATFLVLVRKAGTIRQPELLGNWLYGVAYRTAVRARVQAAQRVDHEMQTATMTETDQPNDVEQRELQEILDEELNRLPTWFRHPLVLCYVQGKTLAEAARVLGCPIGSMSGRLAKAREKLRRRLTRRGLTTSTGLFSALLLASTARSEVPASLVRATVDAAVAAAPGESVVIGASSRVVDLTTSVLRGAHSKFVKVLVAAVLTAMATCWLAVQWVSLAAAGDTHAIPDTASQVATDADNGMTIFGSPSAESPSAESPSAESRLAGDSTGGYASRCCGH